MTRIRCASVARLAAAGAVLLVMAACMELDIANPNAPDRDRALTEPTDVETLIAGTFHTWWDHKQGAGGERAMNRALSQAAEVHSSASANHFTWDMGQIPRQPVPNQLGYIWGISFNTPWMELNRALAAIRDGLQVIDAGLEIGPNGADTPRAVALGKLMQGLIHGFIAKAYDQGFIINENMDVVEAVAEKDLRPYGELMAAARGYLAEAREIAGQNSFSMPSEWMGHSRTNQDIVRLAHSYEARFMASVARTPEERAQVDWNEVLSHIEQGITSDFGIQIEPGVVWSRSYKSADVVSQRYLGPADQSGQWQAWEETARVNAWDVEPFHVETDDRRIHAAGDPEASGEWIEIPGTLFNDPQRGTWFLTPYRHLRWREEFVDTQGIGFADEMTVREMDFLRAEAYIRLGRPADALPIINLNRVAVGQLPPATAEGVSGDRCVPRTITGECGDLLATLLYEKQLELITLSTGLAFWDQRGFGTLREGTPLHLPIPAEELESLQLPVYTFGGAGGEATALGWRANLQ